MSYFEERYDPPEHDEDAGRWQVHVSVAPAELEALRARAGTVMPLEYLDFHTELADDREGESALSIRVLAKTADDAIAEASEMYRRLRAAADLPADAPSILGYISPWWGRGSVHRRIANEAHKLHKQGRHELAVLRIQTACELLIADTLERLLREAHEDAPVDRLLRRPTTLRDEQTQALMEMLTGQAVRQTRWWPAYVEHLKRRNAITHQGLEITDDDARSSLAVALRLHAWLLEARGVDLSDIDLSTQAEDDRA